MNQTARQHAALSEAGHTKLLHDALAVARADARVAEARQAANAGDDFDHSRSYGKQPGQHVCDLICLITGLGVMVAGIAYACGVL